MHKKTALCRAAFETVAGAFSYRILVPDTGRVPSVFFPFCADGDIGKTRFLQYSLGVEAAQ
jgi:hypothetical protein